MLRNRRVLVPFALVIAFAFSDPATAQTRGDVTRAGSAPADSGSPTLVGQVGGPVGAVAVAADRAALGIGQRVHFVSELVADRSGVARASVRLPDVAEDLAWMGNWLVAVTWAGEVIVIDAANPFAARIVGQVHVAGQAAAVAVRGRTAYVADPSAGIRLLSLSSPARPREVGLISLPQVAEVQVSDDRLYAMTTRRDEVMAFALESGRQPRRLGRVALPAIGVDTDFTQPVLAGPGAYIGGATLTTIDLGPAAQPRVFRAILGGYVRFELVAAAGDRLLALATTDANQRQLLLLDMRDPALPAVLAVGNSPYRRGAMLADGSLWAWTPDGIVQLSVDGQQLLAGSPVQLPTTAAGQLLRIGPGSLLQIRAGDSVTWLDVHDVDHPRALALGPGAWPWGAPLATAAGLVLAPATHERQPTAFVLVSLRDPVVPRELARWTLDEASYVHAAAIAGGLVALVTSDTFGDAGRANRVIVYNIGDPSRPRRVGTTELREESRGERSGIYSADRGLAVVTSGPWLVIAAERGMNSNPPAQWGDLSVLRWSPHEPPTVVGRMDLPQPAWAMAAAGSRVVVTTGPSGTLNGHPAAPSRMHLIDLSRPDLPRQVAEQEIADFPRWIAATDARSAVGFGEQAAVGTWTLPEAAGAELLPAVELTTPSIERHDYDAYGWFDAISRDYSYTCWQSGNGPEWCQAPGAALAQAVIDGDVLWVADEAGALWAYQ